MELRFLPNTLIEGPEPTAGGNPIEGGWRRKKQRNPPKSNDNDGGDDNDGGGSDGGDGSEANPTNATATTTPTATTTTSMSREPATNNNHQSIPNQQQQHHLQQQQPHIGGLPPLHHPSAATVAMNSCGIPQQQQHQQQQQQQQQPQHQHQHQQQEQMMLASMPHRRTLERTAVRPIPNGATVAYGVDPKLLLDGDRQSSVRRTRRGSGSVPGSPRIGRGPSSEFLQQQQAQQGGVPVARSPMPLRAAGMKRSAAAATRLGRAENMSSGSLNSIEV